MVLEVATLKVKEGLTEEFEESFARATFIIASMKGYLTHQLKKCIEIETQYILLVYWETLEDHVDGFRKSSEYQYWKELLHHYYEPIPEVLHYK
jgi:heme-degrading monooxygenase HmoA